MNESGNRPSAAIVKATSSQCVLTEKQTTVALHKLVDKSTIVAVTAGKNHFDIMELEYVAGYT